ncbi:MAG: hypothetical protein FWD24_02255 [Treponema sp.]|nr:hypothetical protein [Treponema sp.]
MKAKFFGVTLFVICLLFIFSGCPEDLPQDNGPSAPRRAIAIAPPPSLIGVTYLASYTDGEYNYYIIDGGTVRDTHIGTIQLVHYNGITPISFSATTITENTISESKTEAALSSYKDEETHKAGANVSTKVRAPGVKVNANAFWTGSWSRESYNEKSTVTSFSNVISIAEQRAIHMTIGNNGESAGWYRYAMYAVCDLYFFIKTSLDNEILEDWERGIFVRNNPAALPYFEYSSDGNFDNSPENTLSLPHEFWKNLPLPNEISSGNLQLNFNNRFNAGTYHSLAIDSNGDLWTWGLNMYGQIGAGDGGGGNRNFNRHRPVQINTEKLNAHISSTKFLVVSAGSFHNLAIDTNGILWAWGRNNNGQLGDNTTTQRTKPVEIRHGTKFKSISAGAVSPEYASHNLAIDIDGNLYAWGNNSFGQLGDGTTIQRTSPVHIKTDTKFKSISA